MKRQELFDLVHVNTERKWEKLGTIASVFADVAQDFCSRNRFWWRQIMAQLNTIPGQGTYDLTSAGVIANVDMGELKVEEIVSVIGANLHPNCTTELTPIFDSKAQLDMILNATNGLPSRYFLGYNDDHTLVIDPPDSAYSLWLDIWAMPNPKNDSTSAVIPLIPDQFHRVLRCGMEAYIWEHVYGASNPKYVLAKKDYEDGIMLAQARPRFTTNYAQTLVASDDAIRST
jgi:hypothetical protein